MRRKYDGSGAARAFHGAATRVVVADTAFPHRAEGYKLVLLSEWMVHALTDRCSARARDSYAAIGPFAASGRRMAELDSWFEDGNAMHPHRALGMRSPRQFIRAYQCAARPG